MNFFTKNRILVGAVVLLAAINLAILATIGFHSIRTKEQVEAPPRQHSRSKMVAKELNLTPEQEVQFEELRREYAEITQQIRSEIRGKYKSIMQELGKPEPNKDALYMMADSIGLLHQEQQKATIEHFLMVREICSYEQFQQLQQLFKRMAPREQMKRREVMQKRQQRVEQRRRIRETAE